MHESEKKCIRSMTPVVAVCKRGCTNLLAASPFRLSMSYYPDIYIKLLCSKRRYHIDNYLENDKG